MNDGTHLLVFNAGSSSLKFELFARRSTWGSLLRGSVAEIGRPDTMLRLDKDEGGQRIDVADHGEAAELVLQRLFEQDAIDPQSVIATGHRVVHGGELFSAPTVVDASVLGQLESLADLAPLHNPPSLAVMRAVRARLAAVPMVAVFDTAFFRELPAHASAYALPRSWRERYHIRRYGFHGIAHRYLYERFRTLHPSASMARRVVTLQLGQGCSAAALLDGQPLDTSMGFTPLEGLIMGTRPGDMDVGIVIHLLREGVSWQDIETALNRKSGLLGLSGVTDDVRELLRLEQAQQHDARVAMAAFCHRIHKYLGAYAAVLGGIDAILFGGGIGENAAPVRSRICQGLRWLGLAVDEQANAECAGTERRISATASAIAAYVIPVREEHAIARDSLACIGAGEVPASFS